MSGCARHANGLRGGVLISSVPPTCDWIKPLYHPDHDPLWAVCEDLDVPVNCHGGVGGPEYLREPSSALIQIAELTDSIGGFVFGVENKARIVTFTFNGRMSEESHRVYQERHFVNPWSAYMNGSPVGKLPRRSTCSSPR